MSQSNNSFPFYIHPMNHKRSVQIIKEAKAEIKKMESRRPRTPFCPKNSTRSGFQPGQSRPNSSTSLRSLQFENEEDSHITSTKVSSLQTIKGDSNIKLEPIVVKSSMQPPKLRDSRLKKQSESDFVGLPPITYEDISHKTHGEEYSENGSKYKEEIAIPANCFSPTEGNCYFSCQTGAEQDDEQEIRELSIKRQSIDLQDIEGSTQEDSSCKPDQISSQIAKFLPLLESSISLVRKQDEEAVIVLIHEIHNILEMEGSFDAMFENRTSLLKLLFRLLDSNYPILSLHTANLLLKMKLKDKNLTTVLRFILKLTKDFEIDLEHFHLIETLIKLMQTISVMACPEAVLHATMIIKSLICSDTISKQIVKEFIAILFHHLEDSNLMMDSHKEELDNHYQPPLCNTG
ncbi:uncharacterized protein LOC118186396 [Stegodyphus dumicola]|uniref:uncharacterized protein LOC118186396 n=1 Tax=Stegodyphus dumicola TaxID=202533 RepID=UPI0015A86CCD|nr:uncharacterized protein LOC118186396 [Stegodyphus dumicola]